MPTLEQFVKTQFAKFLDKDRPDLKQPTAVYARVTKSAAAGAETWIYNLKLLDAKQSPDKYPEIPSIKSKVEVEQGKLVAVVLLYGQTPFVIGEVPE